MLRVQPDEVTPLDMERAARWMGGWMQPRRGSEAEARRASFCAPSTHPPTPPLLQALYMVAVAKTPGIAAGVGPEERRTPIAMGLRYATQVGPRPAVRVVVDAGATPTVLLVLAHRLEKIFSV